MIVNVEAAIVCDGRRLVIERSMHEEHAAGDVSLVGGKLDYGESTGDALHDALRREVFEEVGIHLTGTPEYVVSSEFSTGRGDPVVNVVFLCVEPNPVTPVPNSDEVTATFRLTMDDIERDSRIQPWTKRYLALANTAYLAGLTP